MNALPNEILTNILGRAADQTRYNLAITSIDLWNRIFANHLVSDCREQVKGPYTPCLQYESLVKDMLTGRTKSQLQPIRDISKHVKTQYRWAITVRGLAPESSEPDQRRFRSVAALQELAKFPEPDRVQQLRFEDVSELTVDVAKLIMSIFTNIKLLVFKSCAALNASAMANSEPTVPYPIRWTYELRHEPSFRNRGRRYAVVFRWLWIMREKIKQGFELKVLLANLQRNPSLRTHLLKLLKHDSAAGGPEITKHDMFNFVANPHDTAARSALVAHVYWTHTARS